MGHSSTGANVLLLLKALGEVLARQDLELPVDTAVESASAVFR